MSPSYGRRREELRLGVGDEVGDRLHRVGLGVADEADRTALDPARRVQTGDRVAPDASTTRPSTFGMTPRRSSKGASTHGRAVVADGAVDLLHRELAQLAGAAHTAVARRLGALEAHALDAVRPEHLDRRVVEVQVQAPARAGRLARAPAVRMRSMTFSWLFGAAAGSACGEVLVVDDDVDIRHLAELAQLDGRELDVGGTAAAEDVHVGDGRGLRARRARCRRSRSGAGPRRAWRARARRRARRCRCRSRRPRAASSGQSRGTSGWPSYQATKSAAPYEPGRSMPGMSSAASRIAPVARITAS